MNSGFVEFGVPGLRSKEDRVEMSVTSQAFCKLKRLPALFNYFPLVIETTTLKK
jgi:hypothetical protein